MTTRELIQFTGQHPWALAGLFVALPLVSWAVGRIHGRGNGGNAPWKYLYSVLVYLACVPGMFASVLSAYSLFFRNENLLDVNLLVYLLPIVSMAATLILIRKNVDFDAVPGFDRLSGLMVMIGCSFALALAIQKTNIWVFFAGSFERLIALAIGIFALLKWGSHLLFRRSHEPKQEPPAFPSNQT